MLSFVCDFVQSLELQFLIDWTSRDSLMMLAKNTVCAPNK